MILGKKLKPGRGSGAGVKQTEALVLKVDAIGSSPGNMSHNLNSCLTTVT